jgi:hypothetical protein
MQEPSRKPIPGLSTPPRAALLLALHVVTHALRREVSRWAESSIRGNVYVSAITLHDTVAPELLADVPPDLHVTGRVGALTA